MSVSRGILVFCTVTALAAVSHAHDFWVEPGTFQASPGTAVPLQLLVGESFVGEPVARDPARIERFVLRGPDGKRVRVDGREGSDPAGLIRVTQPGWHVVGYRTFPKYLELEAEKFERYLAAEGLAAARQERARRGESDKPGLERYSRCAKTLLSVGSTDGTAFREPLGMPLELVPLSDPTGAAGEVAFQLLYDGRPCSGVQVFALHRAVPNEPQSARTDAEGRVRFDLERDGVWLIKAVHMVPAPVGSPADWESFWASLTFARR